uniref:Small ribosomal subunit protein uS15c n=1 Tax=Oryza sativa subsp. japonica TaxID=39947 RepID=Q658E3_ORYSJ|nr:ribosomal protein S15-like [Oryza sativa Japonica Group]BAD44824.1 ribosomal protein S15-like [Oryza sativa Japonica Group]
MALLLLRRRIHRGHKTLLPRAFSSSSGEGMFPPPTSDPASADQRTTKLSSHFAEIRGHLNATPPSSPPRRIPESPPPDDVRRSLHLFRNPHPSSGATSAAAANPSPSFADVFRARPAPPTSRATGADAFPFSALRESLNKNLGTSPTASAVPLPGATASSPDWSSILSSRQRHDGKPLPESVFGRETRGEARRGRDGKVEEQQFIRLYSDNELGKKLSELRPPVGKDGKEWFSVEELSRRLKKLREMDREERALQSGLGTDVLRDAIVTLQTKDLKTNNCNDTSTEYVGFDGLWLSGHTGVLAGETATGVGGEAEKMKQELQSVRDEFKMSENDCGSARVQVAQLTTKIKHLSTTLHKKDKHSRKGLQEMVQRRKKYLKYLRRTDWDSYCLVLSKLGLRDVPEYKPPDYKSKRSSSGKTKAKRKMKRKMKA